VRVPSTRVDPTAASHPAPLRLTTADGVHLDADVARAGDATGAAVLCHPHPRLGGNRHNAVIAALFRALPPAGITALRFDFRRESGRDDTALDDERTDVEAALDELGRREAGLPLYVAGYSFGAAVGLTVDDSRVVARVAIAPPLAVMRVEPAGDVPTLVLLAAHDQFAPPALVVPLARRWKGVTVETVEMADHFFAGRAAVVASRAVEWLRALP
jgi:alpha/beta superfamily hydrolase